MVVCGKCQCVNEDENEFCSNCGERLVKQDKKRKKDKKSDRKNAHINIKKRKLMLLLAACVVLVVAIVIGIVMIFSRRDSGAYDIAKKLGDKCGQEIVVAEKNAGIHMSVKSESDAINEMEDAKYFYESGSMVKVDGVKVPEWSIKIDMQQDVIHKVYYRNYKSQVKNYKGVKVSNEIRVLKIQEGMSRKDVEDIVDIDPVSITWYDDSVVYDYNYYLVDSNDNEKAYKIKITYDKKFKVKSAEGEEVKVNPNIM